MIAIFKYHFIGMSDKTFSPKVLIDKPFKSISSFIVSGEKQETVSNLIEKANAKVRSKLNVYCNDTSYFRLENVYIKYKGYFFAFRKDMPLKEMSSALKMKMLCFHFFFAAGGASRHHMGYRFIVHPKEEIHMFNPHVHVEKDGCAPRYDLETFNRFKDDKYLQEHIRDEKKIIVPFLKENKNWFLKKWKLYMSGFVPPIETENGKQILKET